MALCAAFLRFITAAASVSCGVDVERADLLFIVLEEVVNFSEAIVDAGDEEGDDAESLEEFRVLIFVFLVAEEGLCLKVGGMSLR